MHLTGAWFRRAETQAVCAMIEGTGRHAWFVGGCVRDDLLGRPVRDIDIATDAHPEEIMRAATAAGLKPVPTGLDHGTVTVVSARLPHEVTTFRRDVETDGRRAVVAFSDSMAEDARRRDFTMNALYADPDGRISDPLGGLPDLVARKVRFIDDARARITEDYLRILRFFRFHAWYGDPGAGMDADALDAIARLSDGIETISRERVGAEMKKLLAAPDPSAAVAAMRATGVLLQVLPGADDRFLGPLEAAEAATDTPPDPIRRLAALGGADPVAGLRLSRKEARALTAVLDGLASGAGAAELGYRLGIARGGDVVLVQAAMAGQVPDPGAMDAVRTGAAQVFPVRSADLRPGLEGRDLGEKLEHLRQRWIRSGFALTREALLR